MAIQLTELFGTKYIYETWTDDLDILKNGILASREAGEPIVPTYYREELGKVLKKAVAENDYAIDIADCCCTRNVMYRLRNFIVAGIPVIDSTNAARNELLKKQMDINEKAKSYNIVALPYPNIVTVKDIVPYVKSFETDKVYQVEDPEWGIPAAVLVAIARPEVSIDVYNHVKQLFDLCEPYIGKMKCSSYMVYDTLQERDYTVLDVDSEGLIYVPGIGRRTPEQLRSYFRLLPADFGSVHKNTPEYLELYRAAYYALNEYLSKHKTMLKYIQEGQHG